VTQCGVVLEDLWFLASRIRHSQALGRYSAFWSAVTPAWHRVLAPITRRRGFVACINGDIVRLDAAFASPYGKHASREYESGSYLPFMAAITPGMHVIDVGAHIGLYTLGAARRVGSGKVYAIEANEEAVNVLRRHVSLNHFDDRVEIVAAAVSDSDGRASFYTSGVTSAGSLARANAEFPLNRERLEQPAREVSTPSMTLDRFCQERGITPDVIKIDVEGAEVHVLRGARQVLAAAAPLIFCEVHPDQMASFGSTPGQLESIAREAGYAFSVIDRPNSAGIYHVRVGRPSNPVS